jgi:hypothetical protein
MMPLHVSFNRLLDQILVGAAAKVGAVAGAPQVLIVCNDGLAF